MKPAWQRLIRCRYQCLSLPPPPPPLHPQESDAEWICRLESWRGGKAHSWQAELLGKQHHAGAGRGGGGGQETLKAFCSVPLVCFPFVYTTLYSWESWPPYSEHPPQQGLASNRAISQYHTWIFLFGFVLFCFVLFYHCFVL